VADVIGQSYQTKPRHLNAISNYDEHPKRTSRIADPFQLVEDSRNEYKFKSKRDESGLQMRLQRC
jgi:hypothetical protein